MGDELFDKSGGYRRLHTFTYATLIHLGTIRFCKRFIPYQEDPLGKTVGQMVGAARSGRQNIIEGSERASTSKETEIKLTDVARASLAELLGDYEIYLTDKGSFPWSKRDPNHMELSRLRLPDFEYTDDSLHDYWVYFHGVKAMVDPWLEHKDDVVVVNAMIILLQRTIGMLKNQIKTLGDSFLIEGGFRERMYRCRTEVRDQELADPQAPKCPECAKPMRERMARNGGNQGSAFWGCSGYPDCRGTRPWAAGPTD